MQFRLFFQFIFALLLLSSFNVYSQSNVIVGKFGKYEIPLSEFEDAYAKNVGGRKNAENGNVSDFKNFMDLYMKFKMKLRDAEVRGYPMDPDLMKELEDYQKQVGVSYIIEKEITEPGIRKLYDRRKEELRVSHIMIRPDTTGEKAARELASAVLDSILNGTDWDEMAMRHSDDRFSATAGGDIYYVSGGLLPAEFEDAMYSLQPGEIYDDVVKTRYGYHLLKVTERHPRTPKIKASHILINYTNENGEVDSAAAKLTADSVLAELNAGVPFEELVQKYSDDTGSKVKDGDLGYFERRLMVKEFDEAAFNMEVGEVSDPVQTNFGYHIIKLTDKLEISDFEEEKEELRDTYKKQQYQADYDNFIKSLRSKYNYSLNEENVDLLIENSDSIRFGMSHPKLSEIENEVLFTINGDDVTIGTFMQTANSNSSFTAKKIFDKEDLMNVIDKVSGDMLLETHALNLPKTNKEFAALMDDYKNGIFIFKLQEEEVWNKVKFDSTDVYAYWEKNKEKYTWPERIAFSEIFSMKDSLINNYYAMLNEGADFDSLATLYTERQGKKEAAGKYELQDVNFSDLYKEAAKLENVGDYSEPVQISGGYSIFKLNERLPESLKTFQEAKAEVSGQYQELMSKNLEENYIKNLEERYNPVIYYDKLEHAFTSNE
jgi:peptidyl-prolyl cis-trans isomerase SurA